VLDEVSAAIPGDEVAGNAPNHRVQKAAIKLCKSHYRQEITGSEKNASLLHPVHLVVSGQ
jgi:hypothetical protein